MGQDQAPLWLGETQCSKPKEQCSVAAALLQLVLSAEAEAQTVAEERREAGQTWKQRLRTQPVGSSQSQAMVQQSERLRCTCRQLPLAA